MSTVKKVLTEIKETKDKRGRYYYPKVHSLITDVVNKEGKVIKAAEYKLNLGKNVLNVVDREGKLKRRKVVTFTGSDSNVVKSLQDETDIKYILEKYGRTGMLPIMVDESLYGDFSEVPDYMEAQNIIIKAEKQFALLNSDVRKRFDNDPAKFLEFCTNKDNLEEMRKLGIAKPEEVVQPQKVEVVNLKKKENKKEKTT